MGTQPVQLAAFVIVTSAAIVSLVPPAQAERNPQGVWTTLDVGCIKPPERKHHTMIYDADNNRVILYGGENESISPNEPLSDLWVLHLGANPHWEEIDPQDATGPDGTPPGLHGHSAAYDGEQYRMLIVAGRTDLGPSQEQGYFRETWALDLDILKWDRVSSDFPSSPVYICTDDGSSVYGSYHARTHAAAGYLNGLFLMGGMMHPSSEFTLQDTWGMNDTTWTYRSGQTEPFQIPQCAYLVPSRRVWHSMIRDVANGRLVVFGGWYPLDDTNFSDVWSTTNGTSWELMGQAPPAYTRNFHAAVYDSEGDRMLVLGGYAEPAKGGITGVVASLTLPSNPDSGEWSALTCFPGVVAEHAAIYDSEGDRVIVFGGVVNSSGDFLDNSTYVLDFSGNDLTPPAAASLSGVPGKNHAIITWVAPGDDGTQGTAIQYDLRRSLSTITECNFDSATPINSMDPQPAGSGECVSVSGLTACWTYYYALKTRDEAGNWSELSNVLSLTQRCSGWEVFCEGSSYSGRATVELAHVEYALSGANPTGTSTTLLVRTPSHREGEPMELAIFDVAGARVRVLAQESATAGEQEFEWDLHDESGRSVQSGIYFARLKIGSETQTRKIVVSPAH